MWIYRALPDSPTGRKILKANEKLFQLAMRLEDYPYALEPVENVQMELIPENVRHQGAGISVDPMWNELELDIYFFPCDFSEDSRRELPIASVRVPIVTVSEEKMIEGYVRKHFYISNNEHAATIPFSLEKTVVLRGCFIDNFENTAKLCRETVKNGTIQEKQNCENFLDFIKTVGL